MGSGGRIEQGGSRNAEQAGAAGDDAELGAGGAAIEAGPVTASAVPQVRPNFSGLSAISAGAARTCAIQQGGALLLGNEPRRRSGRRKRCRRAPLPDTGGRARQGRHCNRCRWRRPRLCHGQWSSVLLGPSRPNAGAGARPRALDFLRSSAPLIASTPKQKSQRWLAFWVVAHPGRFELPTLGFVVRCSIQLSYGCVRDAVDSTTV
jgi:hypothetical protein